MALHKKTALAKTVNLNKTFQEDYSLFFSVAPLLRVSNALSMII
jgi:hypothetical protein